MMSTVHYVMGRLGSEATEADATMVIDLAASLAAEQGDQDFDLCAATAKKPKRC